LVNRIVFFTLIFFPLSALAQLGGKQSFEFLNVANNARLSALGGVNVSSVDRDVNFFYSNPSLVGDTLKGMASVSYQFYLADVGETTVSYAHDFEKIGLLSFGVQHIGYGSIKGYDATGSSTSDLKSGETVLVASKNHQTNNFRFGINVKAAFSSIAGYRASAVMADLGGTFVHPKENLTVGLVMKNLGVVLSDYTETSAVKLPFDLQLGATFKPEHMPFRISITGHNLLRKSVTYYDAQGGVEKPGTFDKVLRRFNFATEILIHKNVDLLIAYNYKTHQELKLANGGGGAGICFGFSARVKAFEFAFSRGGYVAGSAGYTFTVSVNTNKILKRG
jgi:hypothetical protein